MRRAAHVLLRSVQVVAVLLVVVFLPAVAFGADVFTRVLGAVLAAFGVGLFLAARSIHRRVAPKPPPEPPEMPRAPDDIEGVTVLNTTGRMVTPGTLTLDAEGFEFEQGRKIIRRAWRDIELITTTLIGGRFDSTGFKVVGYRLREGDVRRSIRFVGLVRWMIGVDDTVPGWWDRPPSELAELMERYRCRYSPC